MEVSEALRRRRMVRDFDPVREVGAEVRDALLRAGVHAPSAGFSQGVSLLALTGPRIARFWELTAAGAESRWLTGMRRAPLLICVWVAEDAYRRRYAEPDKNRPADAVWPVPWWWVDAGAAIENILLRAVDLGLGACLFGGPDGGEEAIRAAYGVPPTQRLVGAIAVGHPAPGAAIGGSAARRPRRTDAIRSERW